MIEFFLSLLRESPLLFMILVVNLVMVTYLVLRIGLYIVGKKQPGKAVTRFVWKMKAKKEKADIKTIEDVYALVMESLRKDGALGKGENTGFMARKKVLELMQEGEKKAVIVQLFGLYEAKVYGNGRVSNEERVASDILNKYIGR